MKYEKIKEGDVYNIMANIELDIMNTVGVINLVNMAKMLKTSRCQVKKHITNLVKNNMAELDLAIIDGEDYILPYWGYRLTEKGRSTDDFRAKEKANLKLIKECFGAN